MNRDSHTPTRDLGMADGSERTRLALVGVNAWVVTLLVPTLHAGIGGALAALAALLPLTVLGAGVASLPGHVARARWILLCAYPASVAAVVAGRTELIEREAYGLLGLGLAAASLLAFLAVAAHAVGRDRATRPSETNLLLGKQPVVEPPARRVVRRALLALAAVGALAIAILAPTLGGRRARLSAWGEAADDATVLAAVVGSLIAALALATLIGPALRAARTRRDHPARSRRRLAAAVLLATAAGVGWLVLVSFEQAG